MNKDFPQTEQQKKIYDFWSARGYSKVTAVLGNLNVSFHKEHPQYEQLGLCYQYLEQFYEQAKKEVFEIYNKKINEIHFKLDNVLKRKTIDNSDYIHWVDARELIQGLIELKERHLSPSVGNKVSNTSCKARSTEGALNCSSKKDCYEPACIDCWYKGKIQKDCPKCHGTGKRSPS